MTKKPFYITTTLPYMNDNPHIGHALEFIQADALARYKRLIGHDVFFNTGVDEHGQKIAEKADKSEMSRQEYVDHFAAEFSKLQGALDLSCDNFIRTTSKVHITAAQEMWRRAEASGDIYKKNYKGLYCVGCELYVKEDDLVEGKCTDHPKTVPEEIEEENYFFKLSNYQAYLEGYLSQEGVVLPEWRRKEALLFVQGGLEDFSISRSVARMDWGVPVPGDDGHVMYVWFDALTNYISTLGWPCCTSPEVHNADCLFEKFWESGDTLQVAGKDQVRFQSIIWQAMLKSAGLPPTDKVLYHGFINSGGQKMSKSIGNVISPYELVEKYGTEATRYILLRHVHTFDDSDITWDRMDEWYTANLVNGLGNLVARVMKMAETHLTEPIEQPKVSGFDSDYTEALDEYNLQKACDVIWQKVGKLDERIASEQPFKVIKDDAEKGREMIQSLAVDLYIIGRMLYPILPEANKIIKQALLDNKKPENMFGRLEVK